MTATWEIETQIIPAYINEHKGKNIEKVFLHSADYFCEIFNAAFRMSLDDGKLKVPIEYNPCEFYCTVEQVNEIEKMIYIELPQPRKSDFLYDMYVKAYFIPYRIRSNGIEIYDMYGIDTVKDIDTGFIVWYKNSQHLMSNLKLPVSVNSRDDLIGFMSEYIFDRI